MRLIELHIIQSFPVSCLNRDDVGAPKTAVFGGVTRARISSQCLKRAVREMQKDLMPDLHKGVRSRYIIEPFTDALTKNGVSPDKAAEAAKAIGNFFNKVDSKDERRVTTAMFLSPREIEQMAQNLAEFCKNGAPSDAQVQKACKKASRMDAADIAIFGRMVANDDSVAVEGAAMFSHALSTHKAENDIDFFAAVEETPPPDVSANAAAITETLEFTSATYYRYAALNLDMLADKAGHNKHLDHLGAMSVEERKAVVDTFIRATLKAVPSARQNSMNGATLPAYILGVVKEKGQPLQLVNAFEQAIAAKGGAPESVRQELIHLNKLETRFSLPTAAAKIATGYHDPTPDGEGKEKDRLTKDMIPPMVNLDEFCAELVKYVI